MTLILDHVGFERHDHLLFQSLSSELSEGQCLQIRGANGSGKTTLLRMIAGFIEPQQGRILWQGKSIFQHLENYYPQLHYMGHKNGLKPNLTVMENLHLYCALLQKKQESNIIKRVLEQMGLNHLQTSQTIHLSAGQSRRLTLAKLVLIPTPLWILDEPITALDKEGQALFFELAQHHLHRRGMIIIASHQPLPFVQNILELGENRVLNHLA